MILSPGALKESIFFSSVHKKRHTEESSRNEKFTRNQSITREKTTKQTKLCQFKDGSVAMFGRDIQMFWPNKLRKDCKTF
jgi:hypothetical protein